MIEKDYFEKIKEDRIKKENEILSSFVEVTLTNPDDQFHMIRETLTRIGVESKLNKCLYQSCHILRKKGKYYILHFKELFKLDGKPSTMTQEDLGRRNTIVKLLSDWNLLSVVDGNKIASPRVATTSIKIVSSKEKSNWMFSSKYNIGSIKRK